jgi:hypothetical protein
VLGNMIFAECNAMRLMVPEGAAWRRIGRMPSTPPGRNSGRPDDEGRNRRSGRRRKESAGMDERAETKSLLEGGCHAQRAGKERRAEQKACGTGAQGPTFVSWRGGGSSEVRWMQRLWRRGRKRKRGSAQWCQSVLAPMSSVRKRRRTRGWAVDAESRAKSGTVPGARRDFRALAPA